PGNNDRYETRSSNCLTRARPAQVTITDTGFVGQCCTGPSVKEYRAVIEHRRVTRIENDLIELLSPTSPRCRLYPDERTSSARPVMSVKCRYCCKSRKLREP